MPISVKSSEVDRMLDQTVGLTGETKTEAIRRALEERLARLSGRDSGRWTAIQEFLETEVWSMVPPDELGRTLSRDEEDAILGYGPGGV
jgi:antitoxin VapB